MRTFIRIVEAAEAPLIYHTTSPAAALAILETKCLKPDTAHDSPFVSLSEKPLGTHADIRATGVSIGFHPYSFWGRIEKVVYDEEWYVNNMEKAGYVAGQGWEQQWEPPEDAYDEDGFEDESAVEDARDAAQFDAFMDKEPEQEWISLYPWEPLRFNPEDVAVLIVTSSFGQDLTEWQHDLKKLGYGHVKVMS